MKKLMAKQVGVCAVGMMRLMLKFVYFSFLNINIWQMLMLLWAHINTCILILQLHNHTLNPYLIFFIFIFTFCNFNNPHQKNLIFPTPFCLIWSFLLLFFVGSLIIWSEGWIAEGLFIWFISLILLFPPFIGAFFWSYWILMD